MGEWLKNLSEDLNPAVRCRSSPTGSFTRLSSIFVRSRVIIKPPPMTFDGMLNDIRGSVLMVVEEMQMFTI